MLAATLAFQSHFSLATFQLYQAIDNFPPVFPAAAAIAWLLVASVAIPLFLQGRALRGRAYAVLSARTRQIVRRQLSRWGTIAGCAGIGLFFFVALGIPGIGAVFGSLVADYGASSRITFTNYLAVLHQPGMSGPIVRSLVYGAITATVTRDWRTPGSASAIETPDAVYPVS